MGDYRGPPPFPPGTQVPSPAGDNSTNRAWLFDPRTSAYEDLPNTPKTAVAKTVGGMVGEDLYVIGTDAHATNDLLIGTVE